VVAIIAILAAVVFVALDPLTRFQDARDASRWNDATAILSAIKIDQVDNGGSYVAAITSAGVGTHLIGTNGGSGCTASCTATTTAAACVDLTALVTEGYLSSVPQDPSTGTAALTDYYLYNSSTGVIEIGACDPEGGSAISVTR